MPKINFEHNLGSKVKFMRKLLLTLIVVFSLISLKAQDSAATYAMLRYEVQVDLDIFTDLDKTKLVRSKDKTKHAELIADQMSRYRTKTFPYYFEQLSTINSIQLSQPEALEGRIPYDSGVPIPLFPKRALKKKCSDTDFDYFIVTNVKVSKPVVKLVSNIWNVETEIKVLNKSGDVIAILNNPSKLDGPIRSRDFKGGFDKIYREHYDQLYFKLEPYIEGSIASTLSKFEFPN